MLSNIYVDINGHLHPTPFAMPKDGLWRFDGQFFYQTNEGELRYLRENA